jgi:hypothetical protein
MNDNNDIQEAKARLPLPKTLTGITGETKSPPTHIATAERPKPPRPLAELLDDVTGILRRYVVFPQPEQAEVIALWAVHTWVIEAFDFTPYLHVFSAERRSGKSRTLDVLALLVKTPWRTAGVSLAALFRKIDKNKPTLLYDEIDTVFSNSKSDDTKDIQGFLNAGYERGLTFARCVGQNANLDVQDYESFCPKALSGIGKVLPDTTADRCIPIELVRQSREEKAERFRKRDAQAELGGLHAELEAWAQQPGLIEALRKARPRLPEQLNDRLQDACEALVVLADTAGGRWPEQARAALVKLCAQAEEDESVGVQLLKDIKRIFEAEGADKLPTIDILNALVAMDDRPWALWWLDDLRHDKAQKPASRLAKLIKPYGVKARQIRVEDETLKGYVRADFMEAWKRYLPYTPPQGETSETHEGKNVSASAETGETESSLVKQQDVSDVSAWRRHLLDHSKSPFWDMSDEEWAEYDARFNASKTIYPGDWINLTPDETQEDWLAALKQALEKPCELCGEFMDGEEYFWYHLNRHVGRCRNCQEADWFANGYKIDQFGMPSCWSHRHTREERIAERIRNQIQKAARYRARKAGLEYAAVYQALLARESEETQRMIEQLGEKERARNN